MKNVFGDGRLVLIQGGMALKSSMGLSGAVSGLTEATDDVVTVGVVAITGQGNREIAQSIGDARQKAGAKGVLGVNVMAADSRASLHTEMALKTGEIDLVIQGAGVSKDIPKLCELYGVDFVPIISKPEQVAKYLRMFKVAAFIYEAVEAGGHIGSLEHGLFIPGDNTLEQIIAAAGDIPVVAAGAITPDRVKPVLKRGARGIQVATPYLLADECELPLAVKEFYAKAKHEDVILVDSPAGMPGRSISNFLAKNFIYGEESTECLPPEAYDLKCINCIKRCKCRDSGFTRNFCIRAALLAAKNGNLTMGLYFTGDAIGDWNRLTTVKEVTELYLNEM